MLIVFVFRFIFFTVSYTYVCRYCLCMYEVHFHCHCTHAQVLTKSYVVECKVDESDPFSFKGPSVIKTAG